MYFRVFSENSFSPDSREYHLDALQTSRQTRIKEIVPRRSGEGCDQRPGSDEDVGGI
jgi:hypothetical protein